MSFRQVRNPHMKNKRGDGRQRNAVALPGTRCGRRSRSVGGRDCHECCIHPPKSVRNQIARISRSNQRTRHHSIARVRFYAFFLARYRIYTLENRFSSLTFPPPCRRLQSSPPVGSPHQAILMREPLLLLSPPYSFWSAKPHSLPRRECPPRSCSASPAFRRPIPPAPPAAAGRNAAGSSAGRRGPPSRCAGRPVHPPAGSCQRLSLSRRSMARDKAFLDRGGNLLVLGGRPFTRAAYRDSGGWHLRDYSVRFIRPLMIDQYQETPGSDGLQFQSNPEIPLQLPAFAWKRAFSPVIRLSAVDLYHRGGAAGSIDARLDTLAWGVKNGRKLSAPAHSGRSLPQRF